MIQHPRSPSIPPPIITKRNRVRAREERGAGSVTVLLRYRTLPNQIRLLLLLFVVIIIIITIRLFFFYFYSQCHPSRLARDTCLVEYGNVTVTFVRTNPFTRYTTAAYRSSKTVVFTRLCQRCCNNRGTSVASKVSTKIFYFLDF